MKKSDFDGYFVKTVIFEVNNAMSVVAKVTKYVKKSADVEFSGGVKATLFHDTLLQNLKKNKEFANARDNISDFSYKGERWELKTSRTRKEIGVNGVNILEKVKLLMVNSIPEESKLYQIRALDSRDRYFKPASKGTQIRALNEEGQAKAINLYP